MGSRKYNPYKRGGNPRQNAAICLIGSGKRHHPSSSFTKRKERIHETSESMPGVGEGLGKKKESLGKKEQRMGKLEEGLPEKELRFPKKEQGLPKKE